jgi:D-alanyl-D-alanine carboxypeptidase (penicillin-binding protein 5/6)
VAGKVAAHTYRTEEVGRVARFFKRFLLALLVVVILAAGGAIFQLVRALPPAVVSVVLPATAVVPGPRLRLPWPPGASGSVEAQGVGALGGQLADEQRPLASVAKLVTALVVLKHHPLGTGQSGPSITFTAADEAAYRADAAQRQSVVKVVAGEHLSELQALEAMLVASANNVAVVLARWSAGSTEAFVRYMNLEVAALGLRHTRLADPAGLSPASVGSAADMVRLAAVIMANPLLSQIVDMPQVTLPVAGTVYNYDYALGHDGIVGIKTGSTTLAGGNFVFAARQVVAGREETVLGAVLGVQGHKPLPNALAASEAVVREAFSQLRVATVLPAGRPVIVMKTKWGKQVFAGTSRAVSVFGFPGERARLVVALAPALTSGKVKDVQAGERLATVEVHMAGEVQTDPVVAPSSLPPAPLTYKLRRGLGL